jgi:ubiquinone/menaquinone biosynthesis C-methylase UbiE
VKPRQYEHALLPRATKDEAARQDFISALRGHLQGSLTPGNQAVYHARTKQVFVEKHGREPENRREVGSVMKRDPYYQFWSALQRVSQQAIWDSVTDTVERVHEALNAAASEMARANPAGGTLRLCANLAVPSYVTAADIHLMPGGYVGIDPDDMRQGPLYDRGLYLYIGGNCGPENDGLAQMLNVALRAKLPDFKPRRILDMGCTIGNSTVPWKKLYPEAEVVGIDVSATALRYAHARAEALGEQVQFVQANAEFTEFENRSFDLVTSCLLLHETSAKALPRILAESQRLLSPGGVMAHLDVPQVLGLDPLQAFLTSWEEENNNENFAHLIREMDLLGCASEAGWPADAISQPNIPMAGAVDVRNYDASRQLAWTFLLGQT